MKALFADTFSLFVIAELNWIFEVEVLWIQGIDQHIVQISSKKENYSIQEEIEHPHQAFGLDDW